MGDVKRHPPGQTSRVSFGAWERRGCPNPRLLGSRAGRARWPTELGPTHSYPREYATRSRNSWHPPPEPCLPRPKPSSYLTLNLGVASRAAPRVPLVCPPRQRVSPTAERRAPARDTHPGGAGSPAPLSAAEPGHTPGETRGASGSWPGLHRSVSLCSPGPHSTVLT